MELKLELQSTSCLRPDDPVCEVLSGTAESIVPDSMPDVLEVLRCTCGLLREDRRREAARLHLTAEVECCLLYRCEAGESHLLRLQVPLVGEVRFPAEPAAVFASLRLQRAECGAVNSRKVSVRVSAGLCARPFYEQSLALPVGVEEQGVRLELARTGLDTRVIAEAAVSPFVLRDEVELPAAAPAAEQVLGLSAACTGCECRPVPGKVVLKGRLELALRYLAAEGPAECRLSLPFSHVAELSGQRELPCAAKVCVTAASLHEEEGGEGRLFALTLSGEVQLLTFAPLQAQVVCDGYGISHRAETESGQVELCGVGESFLEETEVREPIGIPLPREVSAEVCALGADGEDLRAELLVSLCDGEGVVSTRRVTARLAGRGQAVLVQAQVLRAEACPVGEGAELCLRMAFGGVELVRRELCVPLKITVRPHPEQERPQLSIRRAHKGERYFEIGRRFGAPLEELFCANGLAPAEVCEEERLLLIPRG